MSVSAEILRARDRVVREAHPSPDERLLRVRLLEYIRSAVAFDHFAWLLTDPSTSVGSSPVAATPDLAELPRLIRLKYLTEMCRWTTLAPGVAVSLHQRTSGQLNESLVWRELLEAHRVIDVLSIVLADRYGTWGWIDLWRCDPRSPFTEDELGLLTEIAAPVTAALRGSQSLAFPEIEGDRAAEPPGPAVLLMSPELQVRSQTEETDRLLRILVPPSGQASPVPAAAYNVAAQLVAVEAGVDDNLPIARVHVADRRWVTLRAARLGDVDADIAVTIEHTSAVERLDLFSRAFGLSVREGELLGHLATGIDSREIARRMYLSEHTVGDHLKSVFSKTGCHSRRALLSRVVG